MSNGLPFDEQGIFSGSHGKLIDANGLPIQETQELSAKLNLEHADVKVVGSLWTAKKLIGLSGTGTMKVYQVSTSLSKQVAEAAAAGREFITQLIGEMGDDLGTTQRVLLQNVKFTGDVDLVKFAAQQLTDLDLSFSFVGFKPL